MTAEDATTLCESAPECDSAAGSSPICHSQDDDEEELCCSNNEQFFDQGNNDVSMELQQFLQYAASLEKKSSFDAKLLSRCCNVSVCDASRLIDDAVTKKFLVPVQESSKDTETTAQRKYRFATKDVRKQMFQSIARDKRGEVHVNIAYRLWEEESTCTENDSFVLYQFQRGEVHLLKTVCGKDTVRIAQLCLSEGKDAARASDFEGAATNLNFGVRLLESNLDNCNWKDDNECYQLCVDLYCAAAEANYCDSKFDQAQKCIDAVLSNARNFNDTLGIQATRIYVLGARGQRNEAISVGLDVLQKLGEPTIPAHPSKARIMWGYHKLQHKQLSHKSDESILRLPNMQDKNKMFAMQILNLIFSHAISSRQSMVPLLVFRGVQLTLQYGLTVMSSVAFAKYGMVLCNLQNFQQGKRFAKLALELYERFPVQEWLPRVYLGVYAGVYSCFDNIEATVQPLQYAFQVGLETGDMEIALIEGFIWSNNLFTTGKPLPIVREAFSQVDKETTARKQEWVRRRFSMFFQFVHNLSEPVAQNPTALIGHLFDETTYQKMCGSGEMNEHVFHMYKMILCYIYGDYDSAVQESSACRGLYESAPSKGAYFTYMPLFGALSLIAQLRQQQAKHRNVGAMRFVRKRIRLLKEHALRCPSLLSGKLFLLEAELAWLCGKHNVAFFKYTCAISSSMAAGVLFDHALANERAGRHKLALGEQDEAPAYFQEAVATYTKWGALAKVAHLQEEMKTLLS